MKIKDVLGIEEARLVFGNDEELLDFCNFSKDTRTIKDGDIFLGIKGDNFNGSDFALEAFYKGASTCIIDKEIDIDAQDFTGKNLIIVKNTKSFLIELARPIREKANIPIIAVTGSVGKTSTKNIIADVLAAKYKVLKTQGNLNTLVGMALTFLSLRDEKIIVMEMGMNQAGEISRLTNYVKPDMAVITNIGTAHIGNLGSRENILKAKLEILEGLKGPIIINNDNDLLNKWYKDNKINHKVITYGIDENSEYKADNITYDEAGSHFKINGNLININVLGKHFIYNSIVAFAIGKIMGIAEDKITEKLTNIPLEHDRMELIHTKKLTIINDSYNASYDSVYYALEVLGFFKGRKIALLGGIGELGSYTKEIHLSIGDLIVKNNIDILITVGDNAKFINERVKELGFTEEYHFDTNIEGAKFMKSIEQENDIVLVKASNALKFIEIVNYLKEEE